MSMVTLAALILFGSMLLLLLIGLPIAFSIILPGIIFLLTTQLKPMLLVTQQISRGMDSFPFLAIPLFVFAGYIMESSGMSKRLVDFVKSILGGIRGSMGIVTIISCAIFAALTGSGPATVAAIGSLMMPGMLESKYPKNSAAGIVAAGGALGPIIPPSIPLIIYGTSMGVSIPALFMGSLVPGITLTVVYLIVHRFYVSKWKVQASAVKYTVKEKLHYTWKALGTLGLPVVILGGIYGGIFTPTEAASVAVIYALIVGFATKDLDLKRLKDIIVRTVLTSSSILLILGGGKLFTFLMGATGIPAAVSSALLPVLSTQVIYLAVLSIVLFIAGALLDTPVSIMLIGPILTPVGIALGINPVHLGVAFCFNLCVGYITPPFGINLFTAAASSGQSYSQVVKGALPFMLAAMVTTVITAYLPPLTLTLPNLLGY